MEDFSSAGSDNRAFFGDRSSLLGRSRGCVRNEGEVSCLHCVSLSSHHIRLMSILLQNLQDVPLRLRIPLIYLFLGHLIFFLALPLIGSPVLLHWRRLGHRRREGAIRAVHGAAGGEV